MKFYWSCAFFSFKSINTYGFFWSENKQAQIEGSFYITRTRKQMQNNMKCYRQTHISQNTTQIKYFQNKYLPNTFLWLSIREFLSDLSYYILWSSSVFSLLKSLQHLSNHCFLNSMILYIVPGRSYSSTINIHWKERISQERALCALGRYKSLLENYFPLVCIRTQRK